MSGFQFPFHENTNVEIWMIGNPITLSIVPSSPT
jgi:hypothetical protein